MEEEEISDWDIERSGIGEKSILQFAHPFLRQLYFYWRDLPRPDGAVLPARQQIDPSAIGKILPWVWLADVVGKPARFRYRLVGTAHTEAMGRNVTGEWLDEVSPEFLGSKSYDDLVAMVERGNPSFRCGATVMALVKKGFAKRARLALPLSNDGSHVDTILGITIYQDATIPAWAVRELRRGAV